MSAFVHLFNENDKAMIVKNGIKTSDIHYEDTEKGVFCMPVINDFYATHQWARELMRWNKKSLLGAYFRISDKENVYFGHYNNKHRKNTADRAVKAFFDLDDKLGFQAVIPRSILSKEIYKIKKIPPLGWRFSPSSKGRVPCLCPVCINKGEYGSKKMLGQKLNEKFTSLKHLPPSGQANALVDMACLISDHRLGFDKWRQVLNEVDTTDQQVLLRACELLLALKNTEASEKAIQLIYKCTPDMQASIAMQIMYIYSDKGIKILGSLMDVPEVKKEVDEFLDELD